MSETEEKKLDENSSYMGIPEAPFVNVMRKLEEQLNKYKFMEVHLQAKRKKLKSQIPDIKSSLEIVKEMKNRKDNAQEIETHYMLS
ncbi:hypothetical protein Avbf_01327 [Armadillidium vulgare]|nr:hypothetical protein Avbf_01327 [Armadillidium vulgare]